MAAIMCVYIVSKQLETGEVLPIATRNNLQEAEELVVALQEHWPGIYSIRSMADNAFDASPANLPTGDHHAKTVDDDARFLGGIPRSIAYRN